MKTRALISLLTVWFLVGFSGCNNDEETAPEQVLKEPDIAENGMLLTTPEGLKKSNDPMAVQILNMFNSMNAAASGLTHFKPPLGTTPTASGGKLSYTWSDGQATYWLTYHETANKYIWELDADFGTGRAKYAYVEEDKNGKGGTFDIYVPQQPAFHGEWSYDTNNNLSIEISFHSSEGDIVLTATENADGSGELHYYVNGAEIIYAHWNPDGSGSYTIHTGGQNFTGHWTSNG